MEEQKLVTDEIAQVFRKNCIPFTLSDPYTFSAGTIEHIKQDFKSQTEVRQSDYKKLAQRSSSHSRRLWKTIRAGRKTYS
mgnify:CR=1 FL=1